MSKYQDRVVVITGAGSGIGRILALTYAREGALTILLDKDNKALTITRKLLEEQGWESTTRLLL